MNDFPAQYSSASAVAALLLLITGLLAYLELRIRGNRRSFATIGERDYRAEPVTLGVTGTILVSALCGAYVLLAVVLPVLGLTLVSFSRVYSASFSLAGLSLIHYRALFADGTVRSAILNSFELAALGTFLAAVIGFFSAYVVNRSAGSGRTAIAVLSTIPAAVPGVVFAVGIFQAYIHPPLILYGTLWILLVAYIARHLPYGMRAISASLQQQHRDMERAARSCGAGWLRAMRTVVVPLIMPGVIAGSTIMFVAMVRELSASVLLYSSGNVVNSVLMLEQYSQGAVEKLSAYSLLLTILTLAIVLVAQRLTRVDLMTRT